MRKLSIFLLLIVAVFSFGCANKISGDSMAQVGVRILTRIPQHGHSDINDGGLLDNLDVMSSYMSVAQSITKNVTTKLAFDSILFDPRGAFNIANYRWTPITKGKYLITVSAGSNIVEAATLNILSLYKNGVTWKRSYHNPSTAGPRHPHHIITYVDMNGTTDYLEVFFVHQNNAATNVGQNGQIDTEFSAARMSPSN